LHPSPRGGRSADRRSWIVALARRDAHLAIGALASRRSTVAVFGLRVRASVCGIASAEACSEAPRGAGPSAWRADSRASLSLRLRAAAAGRHTSLRLWTVSGRRPSMSEDARRLACTRNVVNRDAYRIRVSPRHTVPQLWPRPISLARSARLALPASARPVRRRARRRSRRERRKPINGRCRIPVFQ
jgi:hypothetical protein